MSESDSRQLTRDELTTMTAEEIVAAERAGRLDALKRGEPGTPPPPPADAAEAPSAAGTESSAGEPPAEDMAVFRTVGAGGDAGAIASGPLRLAPAAGVDAHGDQGSHGQLSRADLQTMTAAEIVAADRAGRLDDLKRSEADPPPG
ncbi:MAG TPA: hypothetical protein VGP69_01465 [Gaiellaceae bacterium]|jgi:hypothetical protein|nr:hypothetical protein [Gaiellaceae bacterium]